MDGIVLFVTCSRLIAWNPYLEQQRWIKPRRKFREFDIYALGYDQNHNHKILKVVDGYEWRMRKFSRGVGYSKVMLPVQYEIYDFSSNTWKVLDIEPGWTINQQGVTLKGNTYFFATEKKERKEEWYNSNYFGFLLSFDFTKESFGPRLDLPFHSYVKFDTVILSCISQDRLAILRQKSSLYEFLDIWVTNKIEPDAVSWNKFFTVEMGQVTRFRINNKASFFVDEEKKLALVFETTRTQQRDKPTAYIIGEDGYFKSVTLGGSMDEFCYSSPFYLPSLLQIKQKLKCKRK